MTLSKKLQLTMVISQVPPPVHGSTVMTAVLLESLRTLKHNAVLVDRRFSLKMTEVGRPSTMKILRAVQLFIRLVVATLRHQPKVCVLFATTRRGSLLVDWLMSEILRFLRVPTILYLHTVGFRSLTEGSAVWRWVSKRLFVDAQAIVALSPALYADVVPLAEGVPLYAIPNTVADEISRPPKRRPVKDKEVLFVSNLIPEKGAKDFLLVAQKVAQQHAVQFKLIGATVDDRFIKELQLMIVDLQLADCVTIVGPVYGQAKWDALAGAAALVFPSRYEFEAQPLTIIESLHVGTPVIAYKAGAIEDCVISGTTGWTAEPGDVNELADKLSLLLDDDGLWTNVSTNCQALYNERFSRVAYERNWHQVLS